MLEGVRASKLQIDWLEEGKPQAVKAGLIDLEIEVDVDGIAQIDLDLFPDDHSWLGLQLPDGIVPLWRSVEGDQLFRLITAPDGARWWVPALGWNATKRRHVNAFLRGLGQFDVQIGDDVLRLVTRHHGSVQLGDYLRDFRDELIWLILGQEGGGEVSRGGGSDLSAAANAFADLVSSLVQGLPRELHEATGPMRRSQVRPNASTFRALGRSPWALVLPGRLVGEAADIPDNRYLRHLIQTALALAQVVGRAGQEQAKALSRRAAQLAETGRTLAATEWQDVDPEVFDAQLDDLVDRMERITLWRPKGSEAATTTAHSFRIEKPYGQSTNQFFCRSTSPGKGPQVIELPSEVASLVRNSAQFEKDFTFDVPSGHFELSQSEFKNGALFCLHKITNVAAIHPSGATLAARRRRRDKLEAKGWRVQLDEATRKEYRQAGRVAEARAAHIDALAHGAKDLAAALDQIFARLSRLDRTLASEGIGISATPPQGLRWRLHPPHVACLAAFRRLQGAAKARGLDLSALERLERISTLHASALFERWCLVKILATLIGDYRFRPPGGWQASLVDAITRPNGAVSFDLARSDLRFAARLEVQPILANGRRPDFRLRVTYLPTMVTRVGRDDLFADAPGLVMDAKFRSRWARGEVQALVDVLVRQKGYDTAGDAVFVLQPCGGTIAKATSPLSWGRHCDYGQDFPGTHKQGHIWLAPDADHGDPQIHLRRLIAQHLQSRFARPFLILPQRLQEALGALPEKAARGAGRTEGSHLWVDLDDKGEKRDSFSASFCISCGKAHQFGDVERRLTGSSSSSRRREFWVLSCSDCGMKVTRTHCYSCPDTVLFKNHLGLTYHRTVAHEPTHVVCPHCGAYFDEDQSRGDGHVTSNGPHADS